MTTPSTIAPATQVPIEEQYFPVKNGQTDFGSLETVLQHNFSRPNNFLQGFISQDLVQDSGSKHYATVANFPEFIQTLIINNKKDFHLYELIPANKPVRPYFDLEWDSAQLSEKATLEYAIGVICGCLHNAGFTSANGLSVFCSSGEVSKKKIASGKKASYHVIISTSQVFKNVFEHKQFINTILMPHIIKDPITKKLLYWTDPDGVAKCIIDDHPYSTNQNYRLPYQSKLSSTKARQLLPYDVTAELGFPDANLFSIGVYSDENTLDFIQLPTTPYPVSRSSSRPPIQFTDKESPHFDAASALCHLLSIERLNSYIKCRDLIWCLWGLEQTRRMLELIDTVCSRSPKYNNDVSWAVNQTNGLKYIGLTFASLVFWAKEDSNEKDVRNILKKHSIEYSRELFECSMTPSQHTVLNERYLGDSIRFFNDTNTIIIKSHLGTGKTVSIRNLIQQGSRTGCPYKRILVVSPRKSYTHSQSGALDDFTAYLDIPYGDLADRDRIIVQVESLHRIGSGFQKYDLVILDEIESILNQLHSIKTNARHLITNHEALAMAVSTAGQVIMADAFISDRTFHFCKELRNEGATHYFENTFNPYTRRAIFLSSVEKDTRISNIGAFCERICEALRAGRRIVVVWTSKRRGDWFVKKFLDEWTDGEKPSWIFYNSASTKEEQEGLRNVGETWRNVQCLMMTTSITVGISYDPQVAEAEFDEAFLYGSSASAMPRDIAQALFRVRSLKANRLTYVVDTRISCENGVRGFQNVWNELSKKEEKLVRDHPFVSWSTCPQWAKYNYCYCENEERNSRVEYKTVLEEYLVRSGYELGVEVHIPANKTLSIRLELDDNEAMKWGNIDDVDGVAADEIHRRLKRGEATTEEILQHKKFVFRTQFTEGCEEEIVQNYWQVFFEGKREDRFWNVVAEKRFGRGEVAGMEAAKRYAVMSGDAIKKRETMERFLGILGMRHSQETAVIGPEKLEEIGEKLGPIEKEIREGLGLRKSERKSKEWKVANTIDLIAVVLDVWGCGTVESVMTRPRINGKQVKRYSLEINKINTLWSNIIGSTIDFNDNLIRL